MPIVRVQSRCSIAKRRVTPAISCPASSRYLRRRRMTGTIARNADIREVDRFSAVREKVAYFGQILEFKDFSQLEEFINKRVFSMC